MKVVLAALLIAFIVGLIFAFTAGHGRMVPGRDSANIWWFTPGVMVLYLWTAFWAGWAYRSARTVQRLILASLIVVAIVVLASEILGWMRPELAGILHHPVGTVLGYLCGILFVAAIIFEDRARRHAGDSQ